MGFIDFCINRPVSVIVGILLIVLFGVISITKIPVQLTPDVVRPEITVKVKWLGAGPEEIERDIVQKLEEQLKGLEGLVEMTSESKDTNGQILLSFQTGTEINAALVKVSNKINQVKDYPPNADRPVIESVNSNNSAVGWFILKAKPGNANPIAHYRNLAVDHIKPRFERVAGVASSNVYGGQEQEIQVVVDPSQMAKLGITLEELRQRLHADNANISAGTFDEGKRQYLVRTVGEYRSPEEIMDVSITTKDRRTFFIRDIAEVRMGFKKAESTVRQNGEPAIAVNALRQSGVNILEIMKGLRETVEELNQGILADNDLYFFQVYDETNYINQSINGVLRNLLIGSILAVGVLLLFLRSTSAMLVVAISIPLSILGTFLVMYLTGRTINVVSLAGMTFAAGMVVDNAIVVLENVFRHRQLGKTRFQAAYDGTRQVWGAVLASTLTTMAVFIPVVFIEEEFGQLFRDIAIAISTAVGLSMIIAMTVIPAFSSKILGGRGEEGEQGGKSEQRRKKASRFAIVVSDLVYQMCGSRSIRMGVVVGVTLVSIVLTVSLLPRAEYLPEGNRNLIFAILIPPPGYNLPELMRIGSYIESQLSPYWDIDPENPKPDDPTDYAPIEHFFYVAYQNGVFMGSRTQDGRKIRQIIPLFRDALKDIPGMISIVKQSSIFSRSLGRGRSVDIEFRGQDLNKLVELGQITFGQVRQVFPDSQARPIPSLDLGNPEVQIIPDRVRISEVGMTTAELGEAVDMLLDGAKSSDYRFAGETIDLTLMGANNKATRTQDFEQLPIRTPDGETVPISSLAKVKIISGPTQINHSERLRTISISIVPPPDRSLEDVMVTAQEKIINPLKEKGLIPDRYQVRMTGQADELVIAKEVMKWNILLAGLIAFLLMAALFESFLFPLVIMFTLPLAATGGIIGLWLNSTLISFQALDVLTMLGFILLVGTVVNNAILVVHQSLNYIRSEGMGPREAIRDSVMTRIRPIFMSTLTSLFALLPLVLYTGPGSELYRGIGSVVLGGLALGSVFTLFVIPALFSLTYGTRERVLNTFSRRMEEEE